MPKIEVNVGDEVVVRFDNQLNPGCAATSCNASIHWHGIELDADSDGTSVAQDPVRPGESYTYRFRAHRPGVFWFHPHFKSGPQVFAGAYGAFIVKQPEEKGLEAAGILPRVERSRTLMLSDIEFDSGGNVGYLVQERAVGYSERQQACKANNIPACARVADANTVLVNGLTTTTDIETIFIPAGAGLRLELINAAVNRYFRLRLESPSGDTTMYRVGGEGGLLEKVRVEGGLQGAWDTGFSRGETLVPVSGRRDVVIVPQGEPGDVIRVIGKTTIVGDSRLTTPRQASF